MSIHDFQLLLMQMRSVKAKDIRNSIYAQNVQLTSMVQDLKELMQKASEKAEQERIRAEERHKKVMSNVAQKIKTQVVDRLRNEVVPRVVPQSINKNKVRCMALLALSDKEWYVVRRQRETFSLAIRNLLKKNPGARKIKEWVDISHAVDVGNALKSKLRNLKWFARGNILRNDNHDKEPLKDEDLIKNINVILNKNMVMQISENAEDIMKQ